MLTIARADDLPALFVSQTARQETNPCTFLHPSCRIPVLLRGVGTGSILYLY